MIREGSTVSWKWGKGKAEGTVINTYDHSETRTIKGTEITRNGEQGNKALYIKLHNDDGHVFKLESEVNHIK